MKAIVYNLWIMSILFFGHLAYAQKVNSKQWEKALAIPKSQQLFLENQYGSIFIKGWERDETVIKVNISINDKKENRGQSTLEQVKIREEQMKNGVKVITQIEEVKKGFWDKYISSGNRNTMDVVHMTIDYEVNVPKDLAVNVRNKFGDLTIDGWNGELTAVVDHGDIWVNNYLDQAQFTMSYGNLSAKSLGICVVRIENGKVDMDNVEALELHSEGTTISLGQVSNFILNSDKDEIKVDKVGSIIADLKYSKMDVQTLSNAMEALMKLCELRVFKIDNPNAQVRIAQESSDIDLNVLGTSLTFNAVLTEGLLRIPKTFKNIQNKVLDEKKRIREIHGVYGTPQTGSISMKGDKGIIVLSEN
ncbi:MAG: hypothetical protein GYB37_00635 [Algicola sp.]|nr:hypothetical protein [Algicola sp.]